MSFHFQTFMTELLEEMETKIIRQASNNPVAIGL
jgi:hypothetical protein